MSEALFAGDLVLYRVNEEAVLKGCTVEGICGWGNESDWCMADEVAMGWVRSSRW